MIEKLAYFIGLGALGLFIIVKTYMWVGWVGRSSWAETKIGSGGSYTMWKGIGFIMILVGFLILIGVLNLHPNSAGSNDTVDQQNVTTQVQQ